MNMVNVSYEMVERLMISKWQSALQENPNTPKPSVQEIRIEWYRMLEFYPTNIREFENFTNRFPLEDRKTIQFRPYTGTRVRTR